MKKSPIALLLILVMIFGLLGTWASAADDTKAGQAALEEGLGYWFGYGPDGYDMRKAQDAIQRAADLGIEDAWYWLGELAYYGVEEGHYKQAIEYWQKAADQGSGLGLYALGARYREGIGVDQDFEKAADYYQRAVDAGCLMGYNGLGNLSRIGGGVAKDGQKALEYYMKASESADWYIHNHAQLLIGYTYLYGTTGVSKDPEKAVEWIEKAANEGYPRAYRQLGELYQYPVAPMQKDLVKSFKWFNKAAECGQPYNLGLFYHGGLYVERDQEHAVELFLQDVDGGQSAIDSLAALAHCYLKGEGVTADRIAAEEYARRCISAAGIEESDIHGIRDANYGAGLAKRVLIQLGAV